MQWYFSKNGTQLGPVSIDELKSKLASGEISTTDMVWREGFPDWRKAAEISELFSSPAISSPVLQTPPSSEVTHSPYQSPVASPMAYTHGMIIPNYLWQSIVATIFCCWPLGIPAIVYAAKVDGLKARGDIQGALAASKNAKTWCWVAAGSWLVLIVIYIAIFGLIGVSSQFSSP
jgi:Interferon-induced transmembrane protein/GYF domain 2